VQLELKLKVTALEKLVVKCEAKNLEMPASEEIAHLVVG
jgi:hypothetical protein